MNTRETTIPGLTKQDFYLLNKNQTGVYRVSYSTKHLAKISSQVEKLSLDDKIGILADATAAATAAATAGVSGTDGLFSVMHALKNDTSYSLWSEILKNMTTISIIWYEQPKDVRTGL